MLCAAMRLPAATASRFLAAFGDVILGVHGAIRNAMIWENSILP